jgi:hypothetical protein
MSGLVPAIYIFVSTKKVVGARHKPGMTWSGSPHRATGLACRESASNQRGDAAGAMSADVSG